MGETIGPVSSSDLVELANRNAIQPDTPVRLSSKRSWMPAERIKGLFSEPEPDPEPDSPPPSEPLVDVPIESRTYHISAAGGNEQTSRGESVQGSTVSPQAKQVDGDFEFFDFVGFKEAISHALHEELLRYARQRELSITQVTRRALAEFLGKPELAKPSGLTPTKAAAPASQAGDAVADGDVSECETSNSRSAPNQANPEPNTPSEVRGCE
jgi:hypothetical protein